MGELLKILGLRFNRDARVTRLFTLSCDRLSVMTVPEPLHRIGQGMNDYRGWYVVAPSPPFGRDHPSIIAVALKRLSREAKQARGVPV